MATPQTPVSSSDYDHGSTGSVHPAGDPISPPPSVRKNKPGEGSTRANKGRDAGFADPRSVCGRADCPEQHALEDCPFYDEQEPRPPAKKARSRGVTSKPVATRKRKAMPESLHAAIAGSRLSEDEKETMHRQIASLQKLRADLPSLLRLREELILKSDDMTLSAAELADVKVERGRLRRWILRWLEEESTEDEVLDGLKDQLRAAM